MFLRYDLEELNNHTIHSEWQLSSDNAPLTITILIVEEHVPNKKYSIIKGSKEEKSFISDLIKAIKIIDTSNLSDIESLENVVFLFINAIEKMWDKNSKTVSITKYSKSW